MIAGDHKAIYPRASTHSSTLLRYSDFLISIISYNSIMMSTLSQVFSSIHKNIGRAYSCSVLLPFYCRAACTGNVGGYGGCSADHFVRPFVVSSPPTLLSSDI